MEQDLRERPEERFAADVDVFDLHEFGEVLLDRARTTSHGHAQQTLYRHGPATVAMFAFCDGSSLPEHMANGVVTIQTVSGEVTVTASQTSRPLRAGGLLRMAPRVRHSVQAMSDAVILVHMARLPDAH